MKTRKETTQTMKHIKPQLTRNFDTDSASLVSGDTNRKGGQFQIWQTRDGLYNVFALNPNGKHFSFYGYSDRYATEIVALDCAHDMTSGSDVTANILNITGLKVDEWGI